MLGMATIVNITPIANVTINSIRVKPRFPFLFRIMASKAQGLMC